MKILNDSRSSGRSDIVDTVAKRSGFFEDRIFSEAAIYKPVLQMLLHRSMNPGLDIRYVIFAHYPERGRAECTSDADR